MHQIDLSPTHEAVLPVRVLQPRRWYAETFRRLFELAGTLAMTNKQAQATTGEQLAEQLLRYFRQRAASRTPNPRRQLEEAAHLCELGAVFVEALAQRAMSEDKEVLVIAGSAVTLLLPDLLLRDHQITPEVVRQLATASLGLPEWRKILELRHLDGQLREKLNESLLLGDSLGNWTTERIEGEIREAVCGAARNAMLATHTAETTQRLLLLRERLLFAQRFALAEEEQCCGLVLT